MKIKLRILILLIGLFILTSIFLSGEKQNNFEKLLLNKEYSKLTLEEIENYILEDDSKKIIDFAIEDIDEDGTNDILCIVGDKESSYGNEIIMYNIFLNEGNLKVREKYRNDLTLIKPWKIETCEIDGDVEPEIFIAVKKKTHYDQKEENRPFFFNFREGMLVKKWTGTKVRAPFESVYFEDVNGNAKDEFIVIEKADGGNVIAVYYWFGFGFILQGESLIYDGINYLKVNNNYGKTLIEANVNEDGNNRTILLEPSKNKSKNGVFLLKEWGVQNEE